MTGRDKALQRLQLDWWQLLGLLAVVVAIVAIQLSLPDDVTVGPTELVPFIELAGIPIILSLSLVTAGGITYVRWAMDFFLGLIVLATVMNALLLLWSLLSGTTESGVALLVVTHAPEVAGQFPRRLRLEEFNRAARTGAPV